MILIRPHPSRIRNPGITIYVYYEHTVCVTVLGIRPPGLHGSALRLILLLDLGFANDKWIWIQRSKLGKKLLYKFPIKSTKTFLNEKFWTFLKENEIQRCQVIFVFHFTDDSVLGIMILKAPPKSGIRIPINNK